MPERKRLINLINKARKNSTVDILQWEEYNRQLADYILMSGIIVPPCEIADKIYVLSNGDVVKTEVLRITYDVSNEYQNRFIRKRIYAVVNHTEQVFNFSDFGKTVFLTREEAEKALKEREKNRTAQI